MSGPDPTSPWSALAAGWEDLFPLRPARLALAEALAPPGARILDAGCATGSLPRALAARGRTAHGLDLDPTFLDVARRRAEAEGLPITWHLAGLLDLGRVTAGNRFRLITCLGQTLPHLLEEPEWLDFFRQAREALDPGGLLVIQVVNDAGLAPGRNAPCRPWPALGVAWNGAGPCFRKPSPGSRRCSTRTGGRRSRARCCTGAWRLSGPGNCCARPAWSRARPRPMKRGGPSGLTPRAG